MFQIAIPPLREREDDIRGLINFLLHRGSTGGRGTEDLEIDPLAEEMLLAHSWPGNVRELDNVINRARILAEDNRITLDDLPAGLVHAVAPPVTAGATGTETEGSLRDRVRRFENEVLLRAVEDAGGDRKLAARKLGIHVSSLYRKLDDHAE